MTTQRSPHYSGPQGTAYYEYLQEITPSTKAQIDLRKFRDLIPAVRDCVVDFGCGDGSLVSLIDSPHRIGVDVIAENRQAAETRGLEVYEALGDIGDNVADLVISHHALEHTLHPLSELTEIYRVLKRSGVLLLVVPADDWRVNKEYNETDRNHHLYTWTPLALGHLLKEAGFHVSTCRIEHQGQPGRLTVPLAKRLSERQFGLVMRTTAILRRRREILAMAEVDPT
jgi:SAM-dependent methyltransferase